jgi:hypothetical protein
MLLFEPDILLVEPDDQSPPASPQKDTPTTNGSPSREKGKAKNFHKNSASRRLNFSEENTAYAANANPRNKTTVNSQFSSEYVDESTEDDCVVKIRKLNDDETTHDEREENWNALTDNDYATTFGHESDSEGEATHDEIATEDERKIPLERPESPQNKWLRFTKRKLDLPKEADQGSSVDGKTTDAVKPMRKKRRFDHLQTENKENTSPSNNNHYNMKL